MASSNGGKPAARQARGGSGSGGAGTDRVAAKRRAPAKATKKTGGKGQNLESRLQQAEMLLSVSRRVAAIETLDEVLETLVEMTTWELGAERGTLFLNDPDSGELYSRVAQGNFKREIRILNTSGIAGWCFSTGEGQVIQDAYKDPHFNPNVDQQTGFKTKTILCAPVRTVGGEVIGVTQILNKRKGKFTKDDLALLEAMTTQATVALQSTQYVERMRKTREKELEFLDIVSDVTSELDLNALLQRVMGETARMLTAERATLFMNDTKTNELFSRVAMGESIGEIRLPNHVGIAGTVFTSGKTVNIPHAYADLRFSPAFDKQTGYFTRSILCVPLINQDGKCIGVTQVLNKRGGPFTGEDESRLKAFTAQVATALENSNLFDEVQQMKNYNESMLESMSNGVVTTDEDGKIVTCNAAGLRIMRAEADEVIGQTTADYFAGANAWVLERIAKVAETKEADISMDAEMEFDGETLSVNFTVLPLMSGEGKDLGSLLMMEDISSEKRVKSTMARYMGPRLGRSIVGGRRGHSWRQERRRHRPVLGCARFYDSHRGAWRTGHGESAQRLLHHHGGLHQPRRRHARQIHRRRDHGGLRHADPARQRRGPGGARGDLDDCRYAHLERRAHGQRPKARGHGHRPEHRYRGVGQHRLAQAHGLHDDRRRRELGRAPGKRVQAILGANHHQ